MERGNYIGDIIYESRLKLKMTQEEFGRKYGISGPAVFKFEKGYVQPSLALWLRMAQDAEVSEQRGVLLWAKGRLPKKFQEYVELQGAAAGSSIAYAKRSKKGAVDYSPLATREELRAAAAADVSLPQGLRDFLNDDEMWGLYRPTGREINEMRDRLGPLGRGKKHSYREALLLVRDFLGID